MHRPTSSVLRVGAWCVDPVAGQISREGETARVEARTMRLLVCLAEHSGEVVSIDQLITEVWAGVNVSPDSVYQAVTSLRKLLGDDPKQPMYIATVPRLGYRMVAKVSGWDQSNHQVAASAAGDSETGLSSLTVSNPGRGGTSRRVTFMLAGATLCLLVLVALAFLWRANVAGSSRASSVMAAQTEKSIAVLPFLDLTEDMNEEPFADGMTEELIDKLSKVPDFRVPSPTSSFLFKGKKMPIAEIAKALGVAYLLDGSVRKSGGRLRVAARLVRAESGYVVWSETYDRPFDDILMVQDEIAGEVTKALKTSIDNKPGN